MKQSDSTDETWARSYALQALSDLEARDALDQAEVEKCHRLHFLQMAAEKACKAFLIAENGYTSVRKTHAYVASVLPVIARQFYTSLNSKSNNREWEISEIARLAYEIEVLAPACHDGNFREDNSEYPWQDAAGKICVPCEHSFPNLDDRSRAIVRLIRLIRVVCETLNL